MKTLLLTAALFATSLAAGCSNPCDVLSEMCKKCKDANTKSSCESTAATYKAAPIGGGTGCQAVLDAKTYGSCN